MWLVEHQQTENLKTMNHHFRIVCDSISKVKLGEDETFQDNRPILDDWLKEKFLKPWKGVLSIHFCVCVCVQATEHTFLPRNHIFGLNDPWYMRKEHIFFIFQNFHFYTYIGIFRFFFPKVTLVNFCFWATGHNVSPKDVIFGLRGTFTIRK